MKTPILRIVHAAFSFALPFLTAFLLSGAITARKARKSLRCSDPEKRKIRPVCSAGILAGFLCAAFVYFFIGNFTEFSFLEYLLIESFLVMAALPYFILGCVQDSFNLKMETRAAASFVIVLAQILLCFLSVFIDVCEISSVFYLILLLPIAFCFLGSAYDAMRKIAGHLEIAFWGLVIALVSRAFQKNALCFGIFMGGALLAPFVWNLCFKPRVRLGTGAGLFLGVCATFLVSCAVSTPALAIRCVCFALYWLSQYTMLARLSFSEARAIGICPNHGMTILHTAFCGAVFRFGRSIS